MKYEGKQALISKLQAVWDYILDDLIMSILFSGIAYLLYAWKKTFSGVVRSMIRMHVDCASVQTYLPFLKRSEGVYILLEIIEAVPKCNYSNDTWLQLWTSMVQRDEII